MPHVLYERTRHKDTMPHFQVFFTALTTFQVHVCFFLMYDYHWGLCPIWRQAKANLCYAPLKMKNYKIQFTILLQKDLPFVETLRGYKM